MKSSQAIKRLRTRGHRQIPQAAPSANNVPQAVFTPKEAEAILIDVSLRALYNNGDKRELDFVREILMPNKIMLPSEAALESFWDIINNTGLIAPVIGFGRHGHVALTNDGYNLMNQYGSYGNFLKVAQEKNILPSLGTKDSPEQSKTEEPMDGVE